MPQNVHSARSVFETFLNNNYFNFSIFLFSSNNFVFVYFPKVSPPYDLFLLREKLSGMFLKPKTDQDWAEHAEGKSKVLPRLTFENGNTWQPLEGELAARVAKTTF
jgi:L-rhamnose mutarotase